MNDRLLELSSRYLDGEATPAELEELAERIRRSDAERDDLARLIHQHGALHWTFAPPRISLPPAAAPLPARRAARHRRLRPRVDRSLSPWMGLAAAGFLALLVGAHLHSRRTAPATPAPAAKLPSPAPEERAEPAPDRAVPAPAPEPPRAAPPPPASPAPVERPPAPPPDPRPKPPDAGAPPPRPETREAPAAVARLEATRGEVSLARAGEVSPGRQGDPVAGGTEIRTGADGAATVLYPDGARLDLAAGTSAQLVSEAGKGKLVILPRGRLAADVPRQPAGQPMALSTPHAELRVLGTRFTVEAGGESTRLDVREGRVRIARRDGLSAVEVAAGFFAVAAPRAALVSRPLPLAVHRISFGPAGEPPPPGFAGDDGSPFDEARGYGWGEDLRTSTRSRKGAKDLLFRRHVAAGSAAASARWEMALPNGRYLVTVCCGDSENMQGPHRVVVEGVPAIRDVFTDAGKAVIAENIPVEVRDGRLTLDVGAVGSRKTDQDGNSDTVLNYIVITQAR